MRRLLSAAGAVRGFHGTTGRLPVTSPTAWLEGVRHSARRALASAACVCSAPIGNREKALLSCHWITWSARPSTDRGIVMPRALAALRLMTSSNFVGCSMGRSAGFAAFKILST